MEDDSCQTSRYFLRYFSGVHTNQDSCTDFYLQTIWVSCAIVFKFQLAQFLKNKKTTDMTILKWLGCNMYLVQKQIAQICFFQEATNDKTN